MKFTIPIFVQVLPGDDGQLHVARPLFFPSPVTRHERLERALSNLAADLRLLLRHLGKEPRLEGLSAYSFNPPLDTQRPEVVIELRKRVARCRLLFVVFEALGRRVAFTPSLPEVWFDLARGDVLEERAAEVFTAHFREREREDDENFVAPEDLALPGSAWVTPLDLDVQPEQLFVPPADKLTPAALGQAGSAPLDGEEELERVGRCLDNLYPNDLDRAMLRDREVNELARLLKADDRRPVLIVGPPLVGKTTLLHEYVFRTVAERKEAYRRDNMVWLLAPQRLISGMSYVGQWENRLLAILREVQLRDHVLYFDDLLGLYQAGQHSQSQLSAAHVLKPHVEKREVRLVAEMTPEALRVLRERDRGFADLFHVLPLAEPAEGDVLRVLIAVARQLEGQHSARFATEVLPTVVDLQRRYARHLAFPGKAAQFLRRLAVKYRHRDVDRRLALFEFHAQSGLDLSFLDGNSRLERQQVLDALGQEVVGQPEALAAVADVLGMAKARLNDPDRPLGTLLFLGPTGVGKTQCAKALSRFLFGEAGAEGSSPLLRFDMNELLAPGSAARLAGTFDNPEGLLTAAVRRRPFAVVLFDEIEKAHPEVFDLLLQVLGEGRLTDALGRTVDFTNTVIVLTSNLGVREAQQVLGFHGADGNDASAYANAAEKFFRPEFFNRLDRIVPFGRLKRDDISRIARMLIQDVLTREGLVRRKCVLRVEEQALERVIDRGFDPVLGARALKRSIERQLTRPLAARLAAGLEQQITVVTVCPSGADLAVDVQGLAEVPQTAFPPDVKDADLIAEGVRAALKRIEGQFVHLRPQGEITSASLMGEHQFYFIVQEQLRQLRRWLRDVEEAQEQERRPSEGAPSLPVRVMPRGLVKEGPRRSHVLAELAAAQDLHLYLRDLSERSVPLASVGPTDRLRLVRHVALLQLLAESGQGEQQVLLHVASGGPAGERWAKGLADVYQAHGLTEAPGTQREDGGAPWWRLEVTRLEESEPARGHALLVRGLGAEALATLEVGTHLFCPTHEGLVPVQVHAWPVPEGTGPGALLAEKVAERQRWLTALARGEADVGADPMPLRDVVRIYNEGGSTFDLRTGLVLETLPPAYPFVMAALPLPLELRPGGAP